jgi:hypothetical protein
MKNAKVAAEPVPEGEHPVKIIDCQATQSSNGKPMLKLTAEIVEGPAAKRKVYGNLVLSEENGTALAIFFRNLEAIGLDENFLNQGPSFDQVASNCIGRMPHVVIRHRTWNGQVRGDIDRWVAPLDGGLPGAAGGPIAPGAVVGPAGPPLPTTSSSPTAAPTVGAGPTVGTGPSAPADAPPPLPI